MSEGTSRNTIFDEIERFESGKSTKHHAGGGGSLAKIFNQKVKKELTQLISNKNGVSQRKLASHFI